MTEFRGPHVVALCGSLRPDSYTRAALVHVLEAASTAGATTNLIDLRDLTLPVFEPNDRDAGDAPLLRRRVRTAEAIVLGTPTYHGSYSSPLKTAIDYCGFDEFEGKTVGLLAVSGGQSAYVGPLSDLRGVARSLRAWVLPHQVGIGAPSDVFADDGTLVDEGSALADRLSTLGSDAVKYADIAPRETITRVADGSAND